MNEGSVRDWMRHGKFNVTQGKNFTASGALGPIMVTPEEVDPFSNLRVQTQVNGELRQDDVTDNLMFPFRYLIAYLSTFYELRPGDVIATGTPNGAGARFDPPKFLVPGDTVSVQVRVKEGNRERLQAFEGVVIGKKNRGLNSSFIVRKISHGVGVERTFQTYSPLVDSIQVKRRGDVRQAKLYYLRELSGKAARIKEKLS